MHMKKHTTPMHSGVIRLFIHPFDFDYDIQTLVRSFYPQGKIKLLKGIFPAEDSHTVRGQEILLQIHLLEEEVKAELYHQQALLGSCQEQISGKEGESWHKDADRSQDSFRNRYKNVVKRVVFTCLSKYGPGLSSFPKQIPAWGTMTGVRPAKIAMQLLEKGKSPEEVEKELQDIYCCSREKAKLLLTVAEKEMKLLSRIPYEDGYSLYIGIPFCPTTCLYCSFTSYPIARYKEYTESYLTALKKEIRVMGEKMSHKQLHTVYVGGGTPTSLEAYQLEDLLGFLQKAFDFTHVREFTVEAGRPDSITREKLDVLRQQGVTRISVNPQTMKEETLQCIGRHHTVEQTKEAFLLAREAGFDNINMDLIAGLPGETIEDFAKTLEEIAGLNPDSVTIHSLVVKRASELRSRREEGEFSEGSDVDAMLGLGERFAGEKGYYPYYMYRQKNKAGHAGKSAQENIGFAREGKECLYNIFIMEEKQTILALGAGASTKLYHRENGRVERIENVKNVEDYVRRIDEMIGRKMEADNE